jgi:hypothetical protein
MGQQQGASLLDPDLQALKLVVRTLPMKQLTNDGRLDGYGPIWLPYMAGQRYSNGRIDKILALREWFSHFGVRKPLQDSDSHFFSS